MEEMKLLVMLFDGCKEKQKLDKNILFCQNLLTSPPVIKEKDSNSEVVVFCFRSDFGTVFKNEVQ